MRNKLVAILMIMGIFLGCGQLSSVDSNTRITVKVWREVTLDADPTLYIRADNAYAEGQELVVEGSFSITGREGDSSRWVVKKMFIRDGKLIIDISDPLVRFEFSK